MIRALKVLGAAIATAATLAVAAAPASATTYHTKWSYLDWPTYWAVDHVEPPRDLNLNGTYYWRAFAAHWAHPDRPVWTSRTVTLHGRYRWYDDLEATGNDYYKFTSTIKNLATGGRVTMSYKLYGSFGNGNYEWGSTLDNIRAR